MQWDAAIHHAALPRVRGASYALVKLAKFPAALAAVRAVGQIAVGRRLLNWLVGYRRPFASLDEARSIADRYLRQAHNSPACRREHAEFSVRPSDYPLMFFLSRIDGPVTVFDLGGNVGNLFYGFARYLPELKITNWRVFDLPETIRFGARLASRRKVADRLTFVDNLGQMEGADVVIASGCLHYFDEPVDRLLSPLRQKPRHVLINRTPLSDGPVTHTVQDSGYGLAACKLHSRSALISGMRGLGYGLVDTWNIYECRLDIPLHPDLAVEAYSGLYFRLESDANRPI